MGQFVFQQTQLDFLFQCPRGTDADGKIRVCSGNGACNCEVTNGVATDYQCSCHNPWVGDNCDCTTDTASCMLPKGSGEEEECFGRGRCECGRCSCQAGYEGGYCQHDKVSVIHGLA